MMKVFIAIPCHACFTTLLWIMCDILWHTYYCSCMAILRWRSTNISFSCLDLHWTWSLFFFEWMFVEEELKVQQLFSFCLFMVNCKRSFKSSCIVWVLFNGPNVWWNLHGCHSYQKLCYDNTYEAGDNNGGTCHWWRSWWYLRTILTFLALGTFTHPNLLFLIVFHEFTWEFCFR